MAAVIRGNVRKIIKFSAVDGPGNRAAIFLQGCNFNCTFCHNPETIPMNAPGVAVMTAAEVFESLGPAVNFIRGITISGGECMLQQEFVVEIFKRSRTLGLTNFLDSNGSRDFSLYPELINLTDSVMLDVKSMEPEEHKAVTGGDYHKVIKNMAYLGEMGKLYEIRTVCSPELIDCKRTVGLAARIIAHYPGVRYKLIKYRPHGVRKEYLRRYKVPSDSLMAELASIARDAGVSEVTVL